MRMCVRVRPYLWTGGWVWGSVGLHMHRRSAHPRKNITVLKFGASPIPQVAIDCKWRYELRWVSDRCQMGAGWNRAGTQKIQPMPMSLQRLYDEPIAPAGSEKQAWMMPGPTPTLSDGCCTPDAL